MSDEYECPTCTARVHLIARYGGSPPVCHHTAASDESPTAMKKVTA